MFLKSLEIIKGTEIIREIKFHKGLNLIIDTGVNQITGNSVGKTTVLKLIDFCLGGKPSDIYTDIESKAEDKVVKDFLINKKVLIVLTLTYSLDEEDAEKIVIERNFISTGKDKIRKINDKQLTEEEFEDELLILIFPDHDSKIPSFRQIISHNLRIDDVSLTNTLNTITFGKPEQYESLYLFLFGCNFLKGNSKQDIFTKLKTEETFKNRLEKEQTKNAYEISLALINNDIDVLNKKKNSFNLNENFEIDLENLNIVKYEINKLSSKVGQLTIRKNLIFETEQELNSSSSKIDLRQLEIIYQQATNKVSNIQKSFEDLVLFHNEMISEKVKYITKELPTLEKNILEKNKEIKFKLEKEADLIQKIAKSDSFESMQIVINELNNKFQKKGEYETIIQQLNDVEGKIKEQNELLEQIDKELFSDEFEKNVKIQLNKFNIHFSAISDNLYGEKYAINHNIKKNKKNQKLYTFTPFIPFGPNIASGKKQGEISAFDIAYILFAEEENMPCLHFILNDKKELMHDNQLLKISKLVNANGIQFVASMLKDKLPEELKNEDFFVIQLSESNKLFKIENS